MIEWINNNKDWFFSGLGIFILTIVGGVIKSMFSKRRKHSNRTINISGDKSVYVEKNEGNINIK